MKKLVTLLIMTSILSGALPAFAYEFPDNVPEGLIISPRPTTVATTEAPEETEIPDATDPPVEIATAAPLATTTLTVTATVEDMPFPIDSDATLSLYTMDNKFIGTSTKPITRDIETVVFDFTVPEVKSGETYKVRGVSGFDSILYYTDRYFPTKEFTFPIYTYMNADGEAIISTDIAISIRPQFTKSINLYYNGQATNITGARVVGEDAMIPVEALAKHIGFNAYYDSTYNSEAISLGNEYIFFNVDTAYTTVFGQDIEAQCPTLLIDGKVYVSLRTFADAISSEITVDDKYTHMDIYLGESTKAKEFFSQLPVNQWGISSRTNYMVWVSLGEYKVRVYEGKQYQWKPIYEATCAIGAPWSPSIVGSYEYQYRMSGWHYGTYYVGPCLVFHGNYALHSVLLRYDNTEYDGRVGVGISHGCIRLKKADIDYIDRTIPVGTRVYCTY